MKTRRARKKAYLKAKKKVRKALSAAAPKCEPPQQILQEISSPLSSRPLETDTDVDELMGGLLPLSDIELVVITSKHVETVIVDRFLPGYDSNRRLTAGMKVNKSTLNKGMKKLISVHILYQRNDLVHTPGVDNFASKEVRDAFISTCTSILKELLIEESDRKPSDFLIQFRNGIEMQSGFVEAREIFSRWDMTPELKRCSDLLLASSPSLSKMVVQDPERLLSGLWWF
eukprot:sb/3469492/